MSDLNWVGMAHQWCINNPVLVVIFIIGWSVVALYYVKFVQINDKIRRIKLGHGQADADDTFKWFSLTFWTCAITRVASAITMFYGIYWFEAIWILINAYVIVKTYYVYKGQASLFSAKSITEEDVKEAEKQKVNLYRDQLMKKAESKMYKMDPDKRQELIDIIKQEVV